MAAPDAARIAENVAHVRERITAAGGSAVSLVAVTKTHPREVLDMAVDAGCDALGENYVQEIVSKLAGSPSPGPLHMIGAVQSNKVRKIAASVALWQSVDRASVIDEIAVRARSGGCGDILLQVNSTSEASKGGCMPSEVDTLRERAETAGLRVLGLMTIGPTGGTPGECEAAFSSVRSLCDRGGLAVCSMGMTDDFEIAVACGSTMVRIGSAIFGPRP